jgi:hypothetical protein
VDIFAARDFAASVACRFFPTRRADVTIVSGEPVGAVAGTVAYGRTTDTNMMPRAWRAE